MSLIYKNEYDPENSEFYDLEYFLSMEYRYFSNAHRSKVHHTISFLGDTRGKRILDIGGGGGFLAHLLTQCGAIVQVIDYSKAAIQFGTSRFPHIKFMQLSAYELNNLKNHYDIITCFDVIEHLDKPQQFLKQVQSVLLDDGCFYISTDNIASPFICNGFLAKLDHVLCRRTREGRDYEMIKRVEYYRKHILGKNYHQSHINKYNLEKLTMELKQSGWKIDGYKTYHIYSYLVKDFLTFLIGKQAGVHMIIRCIKQ